MRFDLLTIFPEFFAGPFEFGILRRARQQGLIKIVVHDLRSFTFDKHHIVDDRPFGGGDGMVLKPEPIFRAVESLIADENPAQENPADKPETGETESGRTGQAGTGEADGRQRTAVVLLSPQGRLFSQQVAAEYVRDYSRMILICGRYEGVDERVVEHLVTDQISIGDYVLTGGEIPSMVIVDAVARLLPNVLGSETSARHDSFSTDSADSADSKGLLDYPHYTRPAEFRGWRVPEVLISGHHGEVERWRRRASLLKTLKMRPELLESATLTDEERRWLAEADSI